MKRLVPLVLVAVMLFSSCASRKSTETVNGIGVPIPDTEEVEDMEYPLVLPDAQGTKIEYYTKMENVLCWDYTILNSALAVTNDSSFIAGFNKEDMVGTLIYKLYPELENVPSIIKDGQVDMEAVKNSGSEYIYLSDETEQEYVADFKAAGLQAAISCGIIGSSVIGHNTVTYIGLAANLIKRYTFVCDTYGALLPDDLVLELKEVPFAERRSALFLGDTMNSVYTAVCAQEMINKCMAENAAEDLEITDGYMTKDGTMAARYTTVTPELIQEWNPDVIWVPYYADYTAEDVLNNPDFQNMTAVKNGEVYTVPGALEPWYYPTLAIHLGIIWAAYTLYPDICPYERVVQEANSYYADVFNAEFTEEDMGLYKIS